MTLDGPVIDVVAAVLRDGQDRVLLTRRAEGADQGGLWEFPGGKLESGESPRQALCRELREELGVRVEGGRHFRTVRHRYPKYAVRLHAFDRIAWSGQPRALEGQPIRWIALEELNGLPMPEADRPILHALALPDRYPITPAGPVDDAWWSGFDHLLRSGHRLAQLRLPGVGWRKLEQMMSRVARMAADADCRILLNVGSFLETARTTEFATSLGTCREWVQRFDLAGIHLPARLLELLGDRPLGPKYLVGASCHGSDELDRAVQIGCDFACLGPVCPTASHPDGVPMGWERFHSLVSGVPLPIYAIGGIGPEHLELAIAAGGQGIAGISAFQHRTSLRDR